MQRDGQHGTTRTASVWTSDGTTWVLDLVTRDRIENDRDGRHPPYVDHIVTSALTPD